jgi:hypothetical protein
MLSEQQNSLVGVQLRERSEEVERQVYPAVAGFVKEVDKSLQQMAVLGLYSSAVVLVERGGEVAV